MAALIGASGLAAGCEEDVRRRPHRHLGDDDALLRSRRLLSEDELFEPSNDGSDAVDELEYYGARADGTLCLKEDASLCARVACQVTDFCGDDFGGCMTCGFHQDFLVEDGHFLGGTLNQAQEIRAQQIDGETDITPAV